MNSVGISCLCSVEEKKASTTQLLKTFIQCTYCENASFRLLYIISIL